VVEVLAVEKEVKPPSPVYEKIRKSLKDIFCEHELYDALNELSSMEFFVNEALRNLELVVKYSRDPHRLLGDFVGAIVNAYFKCGVMLQSVKDSTVSEDVKDNVEKDINELKDEIWNIVREYLKTLNTI
jgi:hypothetical protein